MCTGMKVHMTDTWALTVREVTTFLGPSLHYLLGNVQARVSCSRRAHISNGVLTKEFQKFRKYLTNAGGNELTGYSSISMQIP